MELQIRFHTCKDKSYTALTTIGMYRFMDFVRLIHNLPSKMYIIPFIHFMKVRIFVENKSINTDMKNNFIRLTLLASLFCNVPSLHLQAQAPHPERIYLSGTGIDNTVTWDFLCSKGQNSGKWKR